MVRYDILLTVKDHPYFLRKAFEVAEGASGLRGRYKTGAIIVVGNRIISEGRNSLKTHPFAKSFSKNSEAIYLHAEHEAILKASRYLGKKEWRKARLYVARTTKSSTFGLAKPCNGCACAINHFKIGFVAYSLDAGEHLQYVSYSTKTNDLFIHSEIA